MRETWNLSYSLMDSAIPLLTLLPAACVLNQKSSHDMISLKRNLQMKKFNPRAWDSSAVEQLGQELYLTKGLKEVSTNTTTLCNHGNMRGQQCSRAASSGTLPN